MNGRVSDTLRRLQAVNPHDPARDGELLANFVRRRDPVAFEQLVRRHGPMVLGVCRRVLANSNDADDAFQATFLVLARRAGAVVPRELVGNWLYGVAYRTALEARRMAARRRAREVRLIDVPDPAVANELGPDLAGILDHELSRLPDRLRLPVVLCDLEGRTRRDVARQLGIPDGTLSNRLSTARRLLAQRLTKRGITLSPGGLAVLLAREGSAVVPGSMIHCTTQAALAATPDAVSATVGTLTTEVIKAMYLSKLKALTAIVAIAGALAVAGVWSGRGMTAEPAQPPKSPTPAQPKAAPAPAVDLKRVLAKSAEEMKSVKATGDEAIQRKADRLVRIAHSQARYGDKPGAAATFGEALAVAVEIKDEWKRAEAIYGVGFYQANSGLTDDAHKTVEKFALKSEAQTQEYRARVQSEIAGALAKAGDVAGAVKVAEAIPERVIKYKDKDGKAVERRDPMQRDWALQHIVQTQLKAGDAAGAAKTVGKVKGERSRVSLVQGVILGLAKTGDSAAAGKLLDELKAEMEKSETYKEPAQRNFVVANVQAALGDAAAALVWIEKLESAEERADALGAVSIGLAQREQWKKSK